MRSESYGRRSEGAWEDTQLAAQVLGSLYVVAALLVALALLVQPPVDFDGTAVAGICLGSLLVGVLLLARARQTGTAGLQAALVLAIIAIGAGCSWPARARTATRCC